MSMVLGAVSAHRSGFVLAAHALSSSRGPAGDRDRIGPPPGGRQSRWPSWCFAGGRAAVAAPASFICLSLSGTFAFPSSLPNPRKTKARLLGKRLRLCGAPSAPPSSAAQATRAAPRSKAARSKAAGGEGCADFRAVIPRLADSVQTVCKPPLKSSSALPWLSRAGPRGEPEQPPAPHLPAEREAGALKYEHLAFYYTI